MERQMCRAILAAALLGATALLATFARAADTPFVVGVILSTHGADAAIGEAQRAAALTGEQKALLAAGARGRPVSLVIVDDGGSKDETARLAARLCERDKACALLAGSSPALTAAAERVADARGVPFLGLTEADATAAGSDRRTAPSALRCLTTYLTGRRIDQVALIYTNDALGQNGRAELRRLAPAFRLTIAAEEGFAPGTTDLAVPLTRIRTTGAQAIVCWSGDADAARVAKCAQQLAVTLPLFVSDEAATPAFITEAGAAAAGVLAPLLSAAAPKTKGDDTLAGKATGATPSQVAAAGARTQAAVEAVARALAQVGDDPARLRGELRKVRLPALAPAPGDDAGGDPYTMARVEGGRWRPLAR